jgi:hypothetical protein
MMLERMPRPGGFASRKKNRVREGFPPAPGAPARNDVCRNYFVTTSFFAETKSPACMR